MFSQVDMVVEMHGWKMSFFLFPSSFSEIRRTLLTFLLSNYLPFSPVKIHLSESVLLRNHF